MQTSYPWGFKCCDKNLTENFDTVSDMIDTGLECSVCGRGYNVYVSHMEYDQPIFEIEEKIKEKSKMSKTINEKINLFIRLMTEQIALKKELAELKKLRDSMIGEK